MDIKRFHVGKRLSETAVFNGTVYLAGQVAEDTTQDIDGQTREVLGHVDRLLAEAGSDKSRILMCQLFLARVEDFSGMNIAWDEWVADGNSPPRATVVIAGMADPGYLIEAVVTAAVK